MNWVNNILVIISSSITVYFQFISYGVISKSKKIEFNYKNILTVLICGALVAINTFINVSLLRIIISFILLLVAIMYLYKQNVLKVFIYSLICFIISLFYEIVLSSLIINTNIIELSMFDKNTIIKTIFSTVIMCLLYYTCHAKWLISFSKEIVDKLDKKRYIYWFLAASLIVLILVDFKFLSTFSLDVYINNAILVACFIFLFIFGIYHFSRANIEEEKTEALLNFLTKYEKIIDEDRENRHEMLNNLLILKSIENKNKKEFTELLNELINKYNKNGIGVKNIYKLPPGLKGIFYYKLSSLDKDGIKVVTNVSKQLTPSTKYLNRKDYLILCKVIGIVLDNAIEASKASKDKNIFLDIHKEKKEIIIMIDNSFDKKVNINKIYQKNYSTKGSGRGLGLHIANNLLNETENIIMDQKIENNMFSTKIIVKQYKTI